MLRSIQFPFDMKSENHYRRIHPKVRSRETKARRSEAAVFLATIPKCRITLSSGEANRFEIKIVRAAVGPGLDYGNLVGASKSVQDEIASWIGLDDRDPHIRFTYRQQRCRVSAGQPTCFVRIEIRCLEPGGEVIKVCGVAPLELGAEAEQNPPELPKRKGKAAGLSVPRTVQPTLPVRTAWILLPWAQREGEGAIVEELEEYAGVDAPPAVLHRPIPEGWAPPTIRGLSKEPGAGPMLAFERTEYHDREMGRIWLYRYTTSPPRIAAVG